MACTGTTLTFLRFLFDKLIVAQLVSQENFGFLWEPKFYLLFMKILSLIDVLKHTDRATFRVSSTPKACVQISEDDATIAPQFKVLDFVSLHSA
jgi:hypothetical protein